MARRVFVSLLLAPTVRTAAAQDAKAVLQAAATAMGTASVKSVVCSGTGWNTAMGQNATPEVDWPRFEVISYT